MTILIVGFLALAGLAAVLHFFFVVEPMRYANNAAASASGAVPLPPTDSAPPVAERSSDPYGAADLRAAPPVPAGDTLAVFEHPFNHYRETVPRRAWLWMLLFGLFYLIARQLWTQVAITVAVLVVTVVITPWLLLLVALPLWGYLVANAGDLICANYLRRGWKRVDAQPAVLSAVPGGAL